MKKLRIGILFPDIKKLENWEFRLFYEIVKSDWAEIVILIKDQRKIIVSLKSRIQKISKQRDIEKQKRESKGLPISATIISVAYKSYKFRFKLDNEETWQLTDTGKRAGLKEGDKIKIVPGTMNSYFLENSRGRFRVKKIN